MNVFFGLAGRGSSTCSLAPYRGQRVVKVGGVAICSLLRHRVDSVALEKDEPVLLLDGQSPQPPTQPSSRRIGLFEPCYTSVHTAWNVKGIIITVTIVVVVLKLSVIVDSKSTHHAIYRILLK